MDQFLEDMLTFNQPYAKKGGYATELSDTEEKDYRAWLWGLSQNVGRNMNPDDPTYDMRGLYKEREKYPPGFNADTKSIHFTDRFKTPYHPTFSRESKYATKDAPSWNSEGMLVDSFGMPTFGYLMTEGK